MFKKSVCIDSVHQCNDDVQNDRIFRGNHQHSRMLLQVRIDLAYSFTVLFIIYKFLKLADKSQIPSPPAAVVHVHWPSIQWSSAPEPQEVCEQSPGALQVSAYTRIIIMPFITEQCTYPR